MKNKNGSTLMIVMVVFALFGLLVTGISLLLFANMKLRINAIEDRALIIELKNDLYVFLNEEEPIEDNFEYKNYFVEVSIIEDNYKIVFKNKENEKLRVEIIVNHNGETYEIIAWRNN